MQLTALPLSQPLDEGLVARLLHQLGDAVHRPLEVPLLPFGGAGRAVQHLGQPVGIDVELERRRALRAERALVVRAAGFALDVDDLAVDGVDERRAPHRAVRAQARHRLGVLDPELGGTREGGREVGAEAGEAASAVPVALAAAILRNPRREMSMVGAPFRAVAYILSRSARDHSTDSAVPQANNQHAKARSSPAAGPVLDALRHQTGLRLDPRRA